MKIDLTDDEVYLLLHVLEAHSANVKIRASRGEYKQEAAQSICKRMCDLSSKLYQKKISKNTKVF